MAKNLSLSGIQTGQAIEAKHVTQSINAFTGAEAYDITVSGSLTIQGPVQGTAGTLNNFSSSYALTASHALNSSGGSSIGTLQQVMESGSSTTLVITASAGISSSGAIISPSFTGSLSGSALESISASFAQTASYVLNAVSASFAQTASFIDDNAKFPFSGSAIITGSLVISSSNQEQSLQLYGSGSTIFSIEGSRGTLFSIDDDESDGKLFSVNNVSGTPVLEVHEDNTVKLGKQNGFGIVISGSNPLPNDADAKILITGSIYHSGSNAYFNAPLTASSFRATPGVINQLTASYAISASVEVRKEVSSSYADTASYVENAQTASFVTTAQTASYVTTAQTASYVTTAQTASYVTTAQTASFVTTAQTASYVETAQTASYVLNAISASYAISASHEIIKEVSSSYADTASFAQSGNGIFSGSFSGSFQGNGSGLTNIPASGITGLNLSRIASGSVTASISPNKGFEVNTDTNISGSLTLSGSSHLISGSTTIYSIGTPGLTVQSNSDTGEEVKIYDGRIDIEDEGYMAARLSSNAYGNRIGILDLRYWAGNTGAVITAHPSKISYIQSSLLIGKTGDPTAAGTYKLDVNGDIKLGNGTDDSIEILGPITASSNISASGYISASEFVGLITNAQTASYVTLAQTASYVETAQTASYVETAQTASYVLNAISSSYALTASYAVSASHEIIKEISSSHADFADTASYVTLAQTASYVTTAQTASYVLNAISSSYALTASYAVSASHEIIKEISSSHADTASFAQSGNGIFSGSFQGDLDGTAVTASYATLAQTASYVETAQTASYVETAQTASYVETAQTASYVLNAISSSYALTASHALNSDPFPYTGSALITNTLTLGTSLSDFDSTLIITGSAITTGNITTKGSISASGLIFGRLEETDTSGLKVVVYDPVGGGLFKTGSYGGGAGEGFPFSGSAEITGSLLVSGSFVDFTDAPLTASIISASSGITGSLLGTASTASYVENAQTASYVLNAQTASYIENAQTASYVTLAQTASFVTTAQTASYVTLAQTASFVTTAQTASYVLNAVSSSYALTASYAVSASHEIIKEISSSHADFANTASYVETAQTASYVLNANNATDLVVQVKNTQTSTILKGQVLHSVGVTGENINVITASNNSATSMPGFAVANQNISSNASGQAIISGKIKNIDTSGLTAGSNVYVNKNGDYTGTKPTGSSLIQNIGVVGKVNATEGELIILGAGRSNDVPNISPGYIWVGNSDSVATPTSTSSIQNVISSSYAQTASYVLNAVSSSYALSASYAVSASHEIIKEISSSHADFADTASYVETAQTASYILASSIDQPFTNITASGNISASGKFIGTELSSHSDLIFDVDGADILLKDGGTEFGRFKRDTSDFIIKSAENDKDIIFRGVDNSVTITALTLDMSDAGSATFNNHITASGNISASGYISASSLNATPGTINELTASHAMNVQPENNFMPVTTHTTNFNSTSSYAGRYNIVGGNLSITVTTGSTPTDLTPGMEWNFFQTSSGNNFTFTVGAGVNLISRNAHTKLAAIGSAGTLKYISDQTFHLIGDLTL